MEKRTLKSESSTDSFESSDDDFFNWGFGFGRNNRSCCSPPKRAKTYPYAPLKPFVRTTVPELKDNASAVVAISLWNHLNLPFALSEVQNNCVKETQRWQSLKKNVYEMTNQLPVPRSVDKQIHKFIDRIQEEIDNWAVYHFRAIFVNSVKDKTVYYHVNEIIWRSDGSINCIETAKNISKSKSPMLSEIEKCRFLCTYCLKEEIQQLYSVLFSKHFQDYVIFDQHPLIRYWSCYFGNKLYLIPKNENESLDCSMFQHKFVDNWASKEYFFDRMSPEDQVQKTIWLIDVSGILYQKAILMKLNESQRVSVYMARCEQIMKNYLDYVDEGYSNDILRTWYDIRYLITEEQFLNIFASLLKSQSFNLDEVVLTDIWSSAEIHLKLYLLNYNNHQFIENLLFTYEIQYTCYGHDFVLTVFQDLDRHMRDYVVKSDLLMSFCDGLFSERKNFTLVDRLTSLLFLDAEKSNLLKRNVVFESNSVDDYCLEYYSTADVKGLDNLLTNHLLSEWPDYIPKYKKKLLESWRGILKCSKLINSDTDLNVLIVDAFGTDAHLQNEFKKELFDSSWTLNKLEELLVNNGLNDVIKIIDRYLTSNEDKEIVKKKLFEKPTKLMYKIFIKHGESYLQAVLQWRLSLEEYTMKELKTFIPLNEMFDEILSQNVTGNDMYSYDSFSVRSNFDSSCFESLDRFLKWFFESPRLVKRYKLSRIQSYKDLYSFKELLRKERSNREHIKILITWFFENDRKEIEKFKKRCKKNSKMEIIMKDI